MKRLVWKLRRRVLGKELAPLEREGVYSALTRLGYIGGSLHSLPKQETIWQAVAKFQHRYRLREGGGEIGPETYRLLEGAVCRFPDVHWKGDLDTSLEPCEWEVRRGTSFSLRFDFVPGTNDLVIDAMALAMKAWESLRIVRFVAASDIDEDGRRVSGQFFVEGPSVPNPLIRDVGGNAIAFATLPCDREPKVCHLDREDWSLAREGESDRFNAVNVAMHEIGHILGMVHSCDERDIMFNGFHKNQRIKSISGADTDQLRLQYGFSGGRARENACLD